MLPLAAALVLALQSAPEKEAVPVPGTKLTFEMVKIPGGPGIRSFWIGAREVTWAEYNVYFAEGEAVRKKADLDGVTRPTMAKSYFGQVQVPPDFLADPRPATNVRWHGANGYCQWLTKHTGRVFRLPTEKEWELAARAGETGAAPASLDDVAWHQGNSGKQTHDVGSLKPNAYGLFDMLGNVWEYCLELDRTTGFDPVLRGGSWTVPSAQTGFASRRTVPVEWFTADCVTPRSVWWLGSNQSEQGFRVVCVPGFAGEKEREEASANIGLKVVANEDFEAKLGKERDFFCRLKLEVKNGTDRAIEELEIRAYYLTPKGKPHLTDKEVPKPGRATFANHWPVLPSSAFAGPHAAPLKPGETRGFTVTLPQSFDTDDEVEYGKFGASLMNVRFAAKE
jgi:formylglycine-generating enzyme required for sulfatase activity